jgi:hypothetical protein
MVICLRGDSTEPPLYKYKTTSVNGSAKRFHKQIWQHAQYVKNKGFSVQDSQCTLVLDIYYLENKISA